MANININDSEKKNQNGIDSYQWFLITINIPKNAVAIKNKTNSRGTIARLFIKINFFSRQWMQTSKLP